MNCTPVDIGTIRSTGLNPSTLWLRFFVAYHNRAFPDRTHQSRSIDVVIPAQYSRYRISCARWLFSDLCQAIRFEDRASILLPRQPVQIHYLCDTSGKWGICFLVLSAARKYGAGCRGVRRRLLHRKSKHSRNSIPCRQLRLLQGTQTRYSGKPR